MKIDIYKMSCLSLSVFINIAMSMQLAMSLPRVQVKKVNSYYNY